ncbi:transposase [Capnocytophaga gingivalis]
MNINHILKHYKIGGAPAYHHRVMIKILFYSYLSNIYSRRKIAKALNENIHFMYIAVNSTGY